MAEKILIVDDDPETLRLVGLMLQRQGYQILSAKTGVEGIRLVDTEKPDLIVLDLMMAEIDGYQVAKRIKSTPATAAIPILVFTAKSQVDDKLAGYAAGADDYITKPVHPSELNAHIKALLARTKPQAAAPVVSKGFVIGVLAAKGGLGVSCLALNLGILLEQRMHLSVIAAELRPGQGTWAGELEFANSTGLARILRLPADEIKTELVAPELVKTTFGVRLLLASSGVTEFNQIYDAETRFDVMIKVLSGMAQVLILDIGTPFIPAFENILAECDEIIVVSEPQPYSLRRTSQLIDDLEAINITKDKKVDIVVVNRVRADLQLGAAQIQEMLGRQMTLVIPPVPELSYHAALRSAPLCIVQPDGLYTQQVIRLAGKIAEIVKK